MEKLYQTLAKQTKPVILNKSFWPFHVNFFLTITYQIMLTSFNSGSAILLVLKWRWLVDVTNLYLKPTVLPLCWQTKATSFESFQASSLNYQINEALFSCENNTTKSFSPFFICLFTALISAGCCTNNCRNVKLWDRWERLYTVIHLQKRLLCWWDSLKTKNKWSSNQLNLSFF